MITLGCRLNLAESESIRATLGGSNDLIVVNSCAVTNEAVAASRRAIRKAARARPEARIVVTGCASEIDRAAFGGMAEVAAVVPNTAKLDATLYSPPRKTGAEGGSRLGEVSISSLPAPNPSLSGRGIATEHARAFLPVQTGCDHRCTFCIIPYGRGPSRSIPAGDVIAAAQAAIDRGQQEVVLTGVDLTAYGADLPGVPGLGLLVERLLKFVPGIARLRLSSLDPCEIDDRLFALLTGDERMMPHVHLSLQAGDDMILKRMKRRHLRADAVRLVERLKAVRPEIAIGADLIAGFPTESEAMFAGTLALLDDCDIVLPHIFPYSPRTGTPAARMPQLEREVIRARALRLREAGAARSRAWMVAHVGSVQRVLIELDGVTGHTEDFTKMRLCSGEGRSPEPQALPSASLGSGLRRSTAGKIVPVRITGLDGDTLLGTPA